MSRVRSSGTEPERVMRAVVRAVTNREVGNNVKGLPGSPDLTVPDLKLAVFVHGCFWHMCSLHGKLPENDSERWLRKLKRTVRRDEIATRKQREMGWDVMIVWEHDLKKPALVREWMRGWISKLEVEKGNG